MLTMLRTLNASMRDLCARQCNRGHERAPLLTKHSKLQNSMIGWVNIGMWFANTLTVAGHNEEEIDK